MPELCYGHLPKMELNNEHHGDVWYRNILSSFENNSPNTFIGHCCEIRSNIEECKAEGIEVQSKLGLRYDGYIHLPLLCLLKPHLYAHM